jgi:hypothetical protein
MKPYVSGQKEYNKRLRKCFFWKYWFQNTFPCLQHLYVPKFARSLFLFLRLTANGYFLETNWETSTKNWCGTGIYQHIDVPGKKSRIFIGVCRKEPKWKKSKSS